MRTAHLNVKQKAHQCPQREGSCQGHHRFQILQQERFGDLCRHQKFQRRGQAAAHLVVEIEPLVEKEGADIVVGGPRKAGDDDEQADHLGQPRDHGDGGFQKSFQRLRDHIVGS